LTTLSIGAAGTLMARRASAVSSAPTSTANDGNDPFEILRNSFDFAYVTEFLHHFWPAIFRAQDDPQPTTSVPQAFILCQLLRCSFWSICLFTKMTPRKFALYI